MPPSERDPFTALPRNGGSQFFTMSMLVATVGIGVIMMPRLLGMLGYEGAVHFLQVKEARRARTQSRGIGDAGGAGRRFDVIIVAGGGQTAVGPPEHVRLRLEKAKELYDNQAPRPMIITTGRGTWYKPCPIDSRGFEITEASMNARWLLEHGVAPSHILMEASAMETIGNAYFSRVTHTDPMGASKIAVINNGWHMPRTKAIFEHVFSVRPLPAGIQGYDLTFIEVADGISGEVLQARLAKEEVALPRFVKGGHWQAETSTLKEMHRWLNAQHDAYTCMAQSIERVADPALLKTY